MWRRSHQKGHSDIVLELSATHLQSDIGLISGIDQGVRVKEKEKESENEWEYYGSRNTTC